MTAEFIKILERIIEQTLFFENFETKSFMGSDVVQTFGVQTLDFMKTEIATLFLVKIPIFW